MLCHPICNWLYLFFCRYVPCMCVRDGSQDWHVYPHILYKWVSVCTLIRSIKHTARHCNTLQHTATHCNTLQHSATHCNTLQHTMSISEEYSIQTTQYSNGRVFLESSYILPTQHTATHCAAPHCNTRHHTATHCNTLQHTVTHIARTYLHTANIHSYLHKSYMYSHTHTLFLSLSLSLSLSISLSLSVSPFLCLCYSYSHMHAHTHTQTYTQTHTHTHQVAQAGFDPSSVIGC